MVANSQRRKRRNYWILLGPSGWFVRSFYVLSFYKKNFRDNVYSHPSPPVSYSLLVGFFTNPDDLGLPWANTYMTSSYCTAYFTLQSFHYYIFLKPLPKVKSTVKPTVLYKYFSPVHPIIRRKKTLKHFLPFFLIT